MPDISSTWVTHGSDSFISFFSYFYFPRCLLEFKLALAACMSILDILCNVTFPRELPLYPLTDVSRGGPLQFSQLWAYLRLGF